MRTIVQTVGVTLVVVAVIVAAAVVGYRSRHHDVARSAMAARSPGVEATPAPPPLAPAARAALDSANAAYRAKHFSAALAQYRLAAAAAPDEAAPYFGIYMAALALHDRALADSALVIIRAHTQSGGQLLSDSSLRHLHSGSGAHPGVSPGGHPVVRPAA